MDRARQIFAVTAFPFLISSTIGGAIVLLGRGVDPKTVLGIFTFLGYVAIAVAERFLPLHRSWLHSKGDLRTDIGFILLNGVAIGLATPLVLGATVWVASMLSEALASGLWPAHWPILAQLALALVIAEFVEYSFHRMMHEVPWLWRFHATHHSAPRLYWLNAARFHPIDLFLVGVVKLVPLAILGATAPIFVLVDLFSAIHGAMQHANLPLRLGPLNWIFSMAELHRWHHSKNMDEANHNYGGNLIFWDIVFGTRWLPVDREPPEEIGIGDLPNFPSGFGANLAAPFRWKRVVDQSRASIAA